jgi:hypothetical protein
MMDTLHAARANQVAAPGSVRQARSAGGRGTILLAAVTALGGTGVLTVANSRIGTSACNAAIDSWQLHLRAHVEAMAGLSVVDGV